MRKKKLCSANHKNPDLKNIEMEYSVAVLCAELMINDDVVVTHEPENS